MINNAEQFPIWRVTEKGRNNTVVPLLISKAAPTDLGVRLAQDFGVTLIGFARGKKMNLYANEWRLK
jgi:formate dehydrogenase accessory protein FdhD